MPARAEADALIARGHACEDAGDAASALACYERAVAIDPAHARAHLNAGNALLGMQRPIEAEACYRRALALDPNYAPASFNLGRLLALQRRDGEAGPVLRQALTDDAVADDARLLLADLADRHGDPREAECMLRATLARVPGHVGATLNLGLLLSEMRRFDDAEDVLRAALARNPADTTPCATLASVLLATRCHEEAESLLKSRLAVAPSDAVAISNLLFLSNFTTDRTADDIARLHHELAPRLGPVRTAASAATTPDASRGRRLRIGYVSGDFGNHPVGLFMRPVLAHHDPARVETFCYANRREDGPMTRELRALAHHWRDIEQLDDDDTRAMVSADGIDVLVDLAGHTARTRLSLFAARAAPVQVTWLGYLNTTGVPAMDWRLCDAWTDPPGETERLHVERLIRMPHVQWCYQPAIARALPLRPASERVVFASFNQFAKISAACVALWCAILREVPASTLRVVGAPEGRSRDRLCDEVAALGVDPRRLEFRDRLDFDAYFAAIGDADVALDTFPYNGATTALDALYMGTPTVGLRGDCGIARGTWAILRAMGATELAAEVAVRYVAINVALAEDAAWRAALRQTLRARLLASPVAEAPAFVRALEDRLRSMVCERQREEDTGG